MKARIFSNWSIVRLLYVVLGILICIQAIYSEQWFELIIGAYFLVMAVFAIGCATGNCVDNSCEVEIKEK